MQRYFFNLGDGHREEDHEGVVLPGPDAARAAAIFHAGELLQHRPDLLSDREDLRLDVTDEQGRHLFLVRISMMSNLEMAKPLGTEPAT
ncbi:MAG: hypothetical protein WA979_13295 [Pacificimonas sp.]